MIKIEHNANEEAERVLRFPQRFRNAFIKSMEETFDISRNRIHEKQIIPDGAFYKKGRLVYKGVSGATIQRRSKYGKMYGKPVFHKLRVVSREGDYAKQFEKNSTRLLTEVTDKGNMIVGYFGLKNSEDDIKNRALEFGSKGMKGRKPVRKGLQWASKRYLAIVNIMSKKVEANFNG